VLLRSTLIYAPAILLTRMSALLLLVIATRLIDQTEYGLLALVVTIGEMTDIAVTNWLRIALLRLGGKGDISRGSLALAGRMLVVTTAIAMLISLVAAIAVVPERWAAFSLAVAAYLVSGSVNRFALTVLQMQQRHSAYSLLELVRAILQLSLPVAAIEVFHASFLAVSLGSSLGALIAGLLAGSVAARRVIAGPSRFSQAEFLALGLPLLLMALVGFGINSAERIVLKLYHDAGAVAMFAAAYALARQPIDMVANAINTGAFPEVVSRFDENGSAAAGRLLSDLMALMVRLCLPVAVLIVVLADDITAIVLPPDYHGRSQLLFAIIAFSVLAANLASFVYGCVAHAHKRPGLLIIANASGSVAAIVLSLLLIPAFAETGAALALAGGAVATLAACIAISRRLTPIPVPWRDIGLSILIAVATGAAAWLGREALAGGPVPFRLAAGAVAGGVAFVALTAAFHRAATARIARGFLARL
jgi:O-antigen/teichoic acid export membrane protein